MFRITYYLLWVFMFTVPWDIVALPLVGSMSRMMGLAATGAAALTALIRMRGRKPDAILGFGIVFAVASALSMLWTLSYDATFQRTVQYGQLVLSLWMVREFIRKQHQIESLMIAFCLGAFIPMASLFKNYMEGVRVGGIERFSATGVNANDLGLVLVIGIPMAWHLILRRHGAVRVIAVVYFVLAPLGVLLTGTRGAYIAGAFALLIVPMTFPSRSLKSYVLAALLLIVAVAMSARFVPQSLWSRVGSIRSEVLDGGRMTGRREIWRAGIQVFPRHPVLGVGAGAYGAAVAPMGLKWDTTPHSLPLGILVEQGVVGLTIFGLLLCACAWTIVRLPPRERNLWGVVMLTWLVGASSLNWEVRKVTWLLFGLVSAQGTVAMAEARYVLTRRREADAAPMSGDRPEQYAGA